MITQTSSQITYKVIGHIKNAFISPADPDEIMLAESTIVINPALVDGLYGLAVGQRIIVIFHFHLAEKFELRQYPRGDRSRPKLGVFALRSPQRPNPIGLSVADLIEIKVNVLRVRGLDAIDGTPVLDIKIGTNLLKDRNSTKMQ